MRARNITHKRISPLDWRRLRSIWI